MNKKLLLYIAVRAPFTVLGMFTTVDLDFTDVKPVESDQCTEVYFLWINVRILQSFGSASAKTMTVDSILNKRLECQAHSMS